MKITTSIKKILGKTGLFEYCGDCGGSLVWRDSYRYGIGYYECSHCNNLERLKVMTKPKDKPKQEQLAENSFIKLELKKVADIKNSFSDDQAKFVKSLVNPDLTDVELLVFLSFSNKLELNPFLGEIISIVYGKSTSDRRVNYIITRNGKRVVATRTGELSAINTEAIYTDGNDQVDPWIEGAKLWGATATVYRGDRPFAVTVPLSEYNTGQNVWSKKPETMIKKVAESQALSAAFPEILGAAYDESELDSITNGKKEITVPNGDEPATNTQIESLKAQGYGLEELTDITRADAVKLLTSKPKKKVESEVVNETTK